MVAGSAARRHEWIPLICGLVSYLQGDSARLALYTRGGGCLMCGALGSSVLVGALEKWVSLVGVPVVLQGLLPPYRLACATIMMLVLSVAVFRSV